MQANKELEELKAEKKRLSSDLEELQERFGTLKDEYEEEGKTHEAIVSKLRAQLKEKGTRRKVGKLINLGGGAGLSMQVENSGRFYLIEKVSSAWERGRD